ncbi:Annexin A7-like [Oopsacas minuta]|uniref:Annexin A7-like n=1 Tax=Oopsacas minuta TaxID=111878 RepID=A0AAV7JG97_9METZ|nr:Annexin A7-like [Oopsacas minuta]
MQGYKYEYQQLPANPPVYSDTDPNNGPPPQPMTYAPPPQPAYPPNPQVIIHQAPPARRPPVQKRRSVNTVFPVLFKKWDQIMNRANKREMQQYQYTQLVPPPVQPIYAPNPQVVVIQQNAPAPAPATARLPHVKITRVTYTDNRPNHLLHFIISIFFPLWIFVWLLMCCCYGC